MPAWLTTTLLATLLTLLSYKLVTRGIATYRQESRDIAAATAAQEEVLSAVISAFCCAAAVACFCIIE